MRYIKVLVLAVFLFLALIFFFQNQAPLSQEMEMTLNLFFIPPMTSIKLPFYFLVIGAFFVGSLLTLFWLVWDKFISSSKLMKSKWDVNRLQNQVRQLEKKLADVSDKLAKVTETNAGETGLKALPGSTDAPADEHGRTSLKKD